jgi:putative ABC transport system substrate-binding protein
MRRREFIAGVGGATVAWPIAARTQQPQMPVVGWLEPQSEVTEFRLRSFKAGLAEAGYVEGRNVAIDFRFAEGDDARLPALVADLVRRRVAVIVTWTDESTRVAKVTTPSIPVVFLIGGDPVQIGVVASLNRPGGNLTGVAILGPDLMAKRLELLHKIVPAADLIAVLVGSAASNYQINLTRDIQSAAGLLGVQLLVLNAVTESEIAAAFSTMAEQHAGAVLVGAIRMTTTVRDQIISLASRHAIPSMHSESAAVAAGALSRYGVDLPGAHRQAGLYVGRILKGEKPADLPVVLPSKFEFAINLKTAKVLGLTVPETLLATADEVIQ